MLGVKRRASAWIHEAGQRGEYSDILSDVARPPLERERCQRAFTDCLGVHRGLRRLEVTCLSLPLVFTSLKNNVYQAANSLAIIPSGADTASTRSSARRTR